MVGEDLVIGDGVTGLDVRTRIGPCTYGRGLADADLTGVADSSSLVQAQLGAATTGGALVIPAGATVKLDAPVSVPAGVQLVNRGTIVLGSSATIEVSALGAKLIGGTVHAPSAGPTYSVRVGRSGVVVDGVTFTGSARTAAVRVSYEANAATSGTIDTGRISGCTFEGVRYGVLKQGGATITHGFHLIGNTFRSLSDGDAIEWNVGDDDRGMLIAHNIIDGVTRGTTANAGIGIGIAGGSYGGSIDAQTRQFAITGNVITGVNEGIHVEACNRFSIFGNHISGGTATAELTGAGVQVYGSTRFTVRGNTIIDCAKGAAVQYGGSYSHSDKYVIAGNDTIGCAVGIRAWCEGTGYAAKVVSNTMTDCPVGMELRGLGTYQVAGNLASGSTSHDFDFTPFNAGPTGTKLTVHGNVFDGTVTTAGLTGFAASSVTWP